MSIRAAILTVSDRVARGVYEDRSGLALRQLVLAEGWEVVDSRVVPDEIETIRQELIRWCVGQDISLILTTGGTGLGPRDVTPEATRSVVEREVEGFGEVMRREGERHTPLASLSRMAAGTRGKSLIINLPGNPDGAVQSFQSIAALIPHALEMIEGKPHTKVHRDSS